MILWIIAALFGACTVGFILGYMAGYLNGRDDGAEYERHISGQIRDREEW